jgi:hypothetical protein
MRLMFIASADGYNGENGDLFVWANDTDEALKFWREQFELDASEEPDWVFIVPCDRPDGQKAGALSWHGDLQAVYGTGPS